MKSTAMSSNPTSASTSAEAASSSTRRSPFPPVGTATKAAAIGSKSSTKSARASFDTDSLDLFAELLAVGLRSFASCSHVARKTQGAKRNASTSMLSAARATRAMVSQMNPGADERAPPAPRASSVEAIVFCFFALAASATKFGIARAYIGCNTNARIVASHASFAPLRASPSPARDHVSTTLHKNSKSTHAGAGLFGCAFAAAAAAASAALISATFPSSHIALFATSTHSSHDALAPRRSPSSRVNASNARRSVSPSTARALDAAARRSARITSLRPALASVVIARPDRVALSLASAKHRHSVSSSRVPSRVASSPRRSRVVDASSRRPARRSRARVHARTTARASSSSSSSSAARAAASRSASLAPSANSVARRRVARDMPTRSRRLARARARGDARRGLARRRRRRRAVGSYI